MNNSYVNMNFFYLNYFPSLIIQHFHVIALWHIIVEYNEEVSRVCLSNPHRRNSSKETHK